MASNPAQGEDAKIANDTRQRVASHAQEKEAVIEQIRRDVSSYMVAFLDSDGFKVIAVAVKTTDLTRVVDDQGRPASLSAEGSEFWDSAAYDRASKVAVTWHPTK